MESRELRACFRALARVQVCECVVEQEHGGRVTDEGPPDGDVLGLAGRELGRHPLEQSAELHRSRDSRHAAIDVLLGCVMEAEREVEVVAHGEVRIEGVVLEHHRHVAVPRADVVDRPAADPDDSFVGLLESGDEAEHGGLPAAGRADEHQQLTIGDVQGQVPDGDDAAVALRHPFEADRCHHPASLIHGRRTASGGWTGRARAIRHRVPGA